MSTTPITSLLANATNAASNSTEKVCTGLILPLVDETNWSTGGRAMLYLVGLLWMFMFIAIIADVFMCAIEVITSKTTKVKVARQDLPGGYEEIEVQVWNDTVANLTLMALGSSAPEILLNVIEICGSGFVAGDLGPGTIIGSAAFNLLVIIAICVNGIPDGELRKIKRMNVFFITGIFAVCAYVWIYIVLVANTKDEVDLWEAIVTFSFFPFLVFLAYAADTNWCAGCGGKGAKSSNQLEIELEPKNDEEANLIQEDKKDKMEGVVSAFMKTLDKPEGLSVDEAATVAAARIQANQPKSRAWYRVKASRELFAGARVTGIMSDDLQTLNKTSLAATDKKVEVENVLHIKQHALVEFDAASCSVLENVGTVKLAVVRTEDLKQSVTVKYETIDGTANAGEDYAATKGTLTFAANETLKHIEVTIIDDEVWEPDEIFFVKLAVGDDETEDTVKLGSKTIMQVTIINDDEPGTVEFTKPSFLIKESVGTANIPVHRVNGADGVVTVEWETEDMTAKLGDDFLGRDGKITFEHGEDTKYIEIPIINDHKTEQDENFQIIIKSASGGAKLGHLTKTIVTIVGDEAFNGLVKRVAAKTHLKLKKMKIGSASWAEQFVQAMNVNGGDVENATAGDYVMHFLTFGFKVIAAFVPPPTYLGGWLCFGCALFVIMIQTALVSDLASILGCLIGLEDAFTAITLVALGTSLPDLFASKTAAINERYADSCIGNVTGSNSVNVFLGLGLPWLIAAIYWKAKEDISFHVPSGSIGFSLVLYIICAVLCLTTLFLRRRIKWFGNAELGGPTTPKRITMFFFLFLWFIYILFSSLQIYGVIDGF